MSHEKLLGANGLLLTTAWHTKLR